MGQVLSSISPDTLLIQKIATLEENVSEMRAKQVQTIKGSTILNLSGQPIIDPSGLNSIANFTKGQLINASQPTTTSVSYVDVPGSTLATFTLARAANVLIYFSIDGYMDSFTTSGNQYLANVGYMDNGSLVQSLFVSGNLITAVSFPGGVTTVGYNIAPEFAYFMQFVTLLAGPHSLKLQMKVDSGGGAQTANLLNWLIGYVIYGI